MNTSHYFYRNVIFSKTGNEISLIDLFAPDGDRQVLEPWFGMVIQLADGQHTIEELYFYLSGKYNGPPPENLKETLHSVVQRMIELKLIVLTEIATELPYYLSLPYEQLDVEKAKILLEQDRARYN